MTPVAGAAFALFAALSLALTVVDVRSLRLPDALVLPGYALAGVLALSDLLSGELERAARTAVGTTAFFAGALLLHRVRPDGLGGGDVKLLGVAGAFLAWRGPDAVALGVAATALLGAATAASALLTVRGTPGATTAVPFGPVILAGTWYGIVVASG